MYLASMRTVPRQAEFSGYDPNDFLLQSIFFSVAHGDDWGLGGVHVHVANPDVATLRQRVHTQDWQTSKTF